MVFENLKTSVQKLEQSSTITNPLLLYLTGVFS
jgi:hypothetical protein